MTAPPPRLPLVRLLANLGYGSRREATFLLRRGRVRDADGHVFRVDDVDPGGELFVDGEPLDPRAPLTLLLHKPAGPVCTRADGEGQTVYDLLPPRFRQRKPVLAPVGRLDKDTTGLLLLTDDGALLHRLTSPRHGAAKVYRVTLDRPLQGHEADALAAGTLVLRSEKDPLLPIGLDVVDEHTARVTVTEGRYHLVRRAFAALGNHVVALHRESVAGLTLAGLPEGDWRPLQPDELAALR